MKHTLRCRALQQWRVCRCSIFIGTSTSHGRDGLDGTDARCRVQAHPKVIQWYNQMSGQLEFEEDDMLFDELHSAM
jgi:hypothetical protein